MTINAISGVLHGTGGGPGAGATNIIGGFGGAITITEQRPDGSGSCQIYDLAGMAAKLAELEARIAVLEARQS